MKPLIAYCTVSPDPHQGSVVRIGFDDRSEVLLDALVHFAKGDPQTVAVKRGKTTVTIVTDDDFAKICDDAGEIPHPIVRKIESRLSGMKLSVKMTLGLSVNDVLVMIREVICQRTVMTMLS